MINLLFITVLAWVFLNDTRLIFGIMAASGFYLHYDLFGMLSLAMLLFIMHTAEQQKRINSK